MLSYCIVHIAVFIVIRVFGSMFGNMFIIVFVVMQCSCVRSHDAISGRCHCHDMRMYCVRFRVSYVLYSCVCMPVVVFVFSIVFGFVGYVVVEFGFVCCV